MLAQCIHFLLFRFPTIQPNLTQSLQLPALHQPGKTGRGWTRHITLPSSRMNFFPCTKLHQNFEICLQRSCPTNENQRFSENRHLKPTLFLSLLGTRQPGLSKLYRTFENGLFTFNSALHSLGKFPYEARLSLKQKS
jgi:hypothetical protein